MSDVYAVIMAGGEGTRFAPLSTAERPKQFLNLIGGKSFLRQTFERMAPTIQTEKIFVSTNERYTPLVLNEIPELPPSNIIAEPQKKNTAPALAFAAHSIARRDEDAVICCVPSDHHISDEAGFRDAIAIAVGLAREGFLVTLGMAPAWASTEYGYIRPEGKGAWSRVADFTEKPDSATAERYVAQGYLWNAGVFVWKVGKFFDELKAHAPDVYDPLAACNLSASSYFNSVPSISIDYALMEKSKRVAVIPCDVGWSDVGTWESLHRLSRVGDAAIAPDAMRAMRAELGHTPPHAAGELPIKVEKPWGHEEIWAHTGDYVGKLLCIRKPHRLSSQYHRVKEETIRILEGVMDLECGDGAARRTVRLMPGDTFHIAPGTRHRMIAVDDCRVLEVSTPYLADVVRVEDDYGRS